MQFSYFWGAESGERGSTPNASAKACARTGDTGMGILIHPEEVTKGSLEEVMKV